MIVPPVDTHDRIWSLWDEYRSPGPERRIRVHMADDGDHTDLSRYESLAEKEEILLNKTSF